MKIGLLGGSFNPAHDGHLHISELALKRLRLDQVWWLVSPQNPIKSTDGMAPFETRFGRARDFVRHPRIKVTGIENKLGTRYTCDTLQALKRRNPGTRFVWLMGADNLLQIPRWQGWSSIFHSVGVAVFPRPTYSLRALAGQAAVRFAGARLPESRAGRLAETDPPAWVFLHVAENPQSATAIRSETAQREKEE